MSFVMCSTGLLHKAWRRKEKSCLAILITHTLNFSLSVICFSSVADKKMMASASTAGNQQLYSQGSPFQPGHSGKTFRYCSPDPECISFFLTAADCSPSIQWLQNQSEMQGLSLHEWTLLVYTSLLCDVSAVRLDLLSEMIWVFLLKIVAGK